MIEAKSGVKARFELSTIEITADITSASNRLTNISPADIAILNSMEQGIKLVHSKLADKTKVVTIGTDYVDINYNALDSEAGATVSAGNGLDICFKEVEEYFGVTIDRWSYLDTIEGVMNQYPSIEILGDEIDTDYLSEDEAPDTRAWDICSINVWLINTGNDRLSVSNWALYCRDAIRRLVDLDNTFGDRFNSVRLTTADLSDMFQFKERQDFLKYLVQGINVRKLALY